MKRYEVTYQRRAHGAIGVFTPATPKFLTADSPGEAWNILWELEESAGWEIHNATMKESNE